MTYDHWKTTEPEQDREPPSTSALERLGVPGLTHVLDQYRSDIQFSSTLDAGQKERRLAMIDAALEDFGDE